MYKPGSHSNQIFNDGDAFASQPFGDLWRGKSKVEMESVGPRHPCTEHEEAHDGRRARNNRQINLGANQFPSNDGTSPLQLLS